MKADGQIAIVPKRIVTAIAELRVPMVRDGREAARVCEPPRHCREQSGLYREDDGLVPETSGKLL